MQSSALNDYRPLKLIRSNHRFSTYEGYLNGKNVFIKYAIDSKLRDRFTIEANGITAMKKLDPFEKLYRVPDVIKVSDTYLVTEWADGYQMSVDFKENNTKNIQSHLLSLTKLFTFVDQSTESGVINSNEVDKLVDKHISNLMNLGYEEYVINMRALEIADYLKNNSKYIETRTTNGDLQPGNILINDKQELILIDHETYRSSWPRHYNIINFVFNYAATYPLLHTNLKSILMNYSDEIKIDISSNLLSFNFSAALRVLQIIEEKVSSAQFSNDAKAYIQQSANNILEDRLFI